MNMVVYSVPKIHCGHCTQTIETELAELPGVEAVKASLEDRKVMVRFSEPATEDSVKALLTEINYPAE
ncbi:MAG TPA: heavy-metal-associated domain-containing protein [Anaerolineales bacterium]|nr:heavy-metal-associated domain-containing protein [Anaerolineales bacterium]HRQ91417.1 heavy-metal-associated domain-containing protein [Anaerolineales bacterium]